MMHPDPIDPPALQMPPPAVGEVQQAAATEHQSATVTVTCVSLEGATVDLSFQRRTTLRAMQKPLCSAFGKNWPFSAAAVCVGEQAFADFEDSGNLISRATISWVSNSPQQTENKQLDKLKS